jgi:hypothetical protein
MRRSCCALLALSAAAVMALAPAAGAKTTVRFGCHADAIHAVPSGSSAAFDPQVFDATPCANADRSSTKPQSSGSLQIGAAGAFTHIQSRKQAAGAGTLASLTDFHVSGSGDDVKIASAQASASYACVAGVLDSSDASQVGQITINGKVVPLSDPTKTERIPIDSHGSYLEINQPGGASNTTSRIAAFVHIVGTGDYTIAAAEVSQAISNPCARTSGFPPAVHPCTLGTSYDPAKQECLITAFTKRPIFISRPFKGPIGVTLYALRHARSVTGSSRCLKGRGPNYVMVGTQAAGGLIEGTGKADRIVTLSGNYTIDGAGGKDCISAGRGGNAIYDRNSDVTIYGGTGSTKIKVGNGRDRIILGAGTSIVSVGNGDDFIQGAAGFAKIHAGNGRDHIQAGPGIEKIFAGRGADVIRTAVGFDEITAEGSAARVTCVDRALVSVPAAAAGFARAHGCQRVSVR